MGQEKSKEKSLIIGFCILLRVILTVNNNTFCFATIEKVLLFTVKEKSIEVTGIELTLEKEKIIIIAVYRSPSGVILEFFTYLTEILEQVELF
jgi:hypothetical protein